ncbi:hypothetical protein [Proteiniclasticum ruminis]|uniref:Uncharacterized protein n=1 Tax=Proteiniclasticum ruminis TaxID=398199 RepID=A0A1G8LR73_9CLOT|nr:hypothetical protein [Proteiniclasticum ruminis]SDI57700.1 hypothetical protein SAMN05421804_103147 [Proteiniclasticum ruminis]
MQNPYGTVYKVFIEFNEHELKTEADVRSFINHHFSVETLDVDIGVKNVILNDHSLQLVWKVPVHEGVHEIENSLHYILKDGRIGSYSWKCQE